MDFMDLENVGEVEESAVEWLGPRSLRTGRAKGECSGSSLAAPEDAGAMSIGDWDGRDLHRKRSRVSSDSVNNNYATSLIKNTANSIVDSDGHHASFQGSSASATTNEMFCRTYMFSDVDFGHSLEYDDEMEEDIDGYASDKAEEQEVRMDLTDDLLHMVFSFLGLTDLCRAAVVCRQWRAASAHEDFWRSLNFKNRNISIEQFEDMSSRYPNAIEVNLTGAPAIHLLAMKAISSLRNLETLTLGRGRLGDAFFHALADCNVLRTLNVTDATLGNGTQEIPINHDNLHRLRLIKCRVMRISVRCPQLKTMSLKRSNMAQAQLNCPLLHGLDIGSCHKLSDAAIRSAAISCPMLKSLDMSNCSCVSDETLQEIASSCANLRNLDASYCPSIALESVRLPMLTVLKLDNCDGITSASMSAISHSSMLEVLELDNCSLLTSVFLDLPKLQHISLVHSRKISDLNLRTLMLSSIMVSNCPALHCINLTSNSLQKLVLQKQERLSTLVLQCQSLQEVDLTYCESLTDSICEVFSDGGGCPMLKSLVLDNCENLMTARFCSTSLESLSLAGCRAVTALELNCPHLQQLCLDGCDHLERASFCRVGLRSLNLGICPKLSELVIEAPEMFLLELKGCGVLSEASINCPLLTSLDASFCSQLKDECLSAVAASCPLIETLILTSCPSIGYDGLRSLYCLPRLTTLDLSYTFLIDLLPVFESCSQLKVLRLQACKYLANFFLEPLYKQGALPLLRELDLSYGSICQSAIEELLACCTHLTHVNLNGCVNMHDLDWTGPSVGPSDMIQCEPTDGRSEWHLEILNCVGCPNIRKVFIPPPAQCFHLSSLNLSLSANLKEVNISCLNLCFLNLSHCSSLEILKLNCPRLTSLFLQSCNIDEGTLEAAISQCTMLETLDVRFCPKIASVSTGRLRTLFHSLKRIFNSPQPV